MLDQDDGVDAGSAGGADERLHHAVLLRRGHPRRRFVEQNHLRLQGKGGGDVEQLLLALRQQARQRSEPLLEAEDAGDLGNARGDLPVGEQG